MAFFRSKTVNLLNLHYGIHAIALSGGGAFFAVYLLKSGVSPGDSSSGPSSCPSPCVPA
jgi:hypothetical protein